MYFIEKYYAFWLDTFNFKKIIQEGGDKNYFKIANLFIFWYLKFFFIYALIIVKNFEFAVYVLFYTIIFIVLNLTVRRFLIKYYITYISSAFFLVFHLLGGLIFIDGVRLYDYYIYGVLRYDWLIHFIGGFLATFIAYDFVKRFFMRKSVSAPLFVFMILSLAIGLGTYNEIFEFMAVLFLNAEKAVGDYYNNLWDIINNLLGSIVAIIILLKERVNKI